MASKKARMVTVELDNRRVVGVAEASRACRYICKDAVQVGW
jgi:hypothetical protein